KKLGVHNVSKETGLFRYLDRYYTKMLAWSMAHRKSMVALSIGVTFSTVPLFMMVGKNFVPTDDRAEFQVSVRAPEGTSLAATTTIAERIARDMRGLPGVTATLTSIGNNTSGFGGVAIGMANRASIYVKLSPRDQREKSQQDLMLAAREIGTTYPPEIKVAVM